jgi:hypothetical protein
MAIYQCSWPYVIADTGSGHETWCPAHGNWRSELAVAEQGGHGAPPAIAVTMAPGDAERLVAQERKRGRRGG